MNADAVMLASQQPLLDYLEQRTLRNARILAALASSIRCQWLDDSEDNELEELEEERARLAANGPRTEEMRGAWEAALQRYDSAIVALRKALGA